jgi:hypothetical protein
MSRFETPTNEIFGIVDDALDKIERTGRAPKKAPRVPRSALPKMRVKRSELLPEMENVDLGNVVYVPESVLKSLTTSLNSETGKLNRLMLQKLMPMLLAYQTSTNYTKAALKEGLDLEVDFDPGLADCVKHIGYLNVVMHFIKCSKLPISVKKRFINKFSDSLALQAVSSMVEENKLQTKKLLQDHLQAVVYSRQKDKMEVRTRSDGTKKPSKTTATKKSVPVAEEPEVKTSGVRRSRR